VSGGHRDSLGEVNGAASSQGDDQVTVISPRDGTCGIHRSACRVRLYLVINQDLQSGGFQDGLNAAGQPQLRKVACSHKEDATPQPTGFLTQGRQLAGTEHYFSRPLQNELGRHG
jgi:hypothetical protein